MHYIKRYLHQQSGLVIGRQQPYLGDATESTVNHITFVGMLQGFIISLWMQGF